jgi:protein arginine N-methyltransferase 1
MLQDTDRVSAFLEAIVSSVREGFRVVELGGGTGILSYFAARQGAEVVCVERNPDLVRAARRFLENNLSRVEFERVSVIHADAFNYTPDQPVDVVICEMLHTAMLREKQLEMIHSFKQRYIAAVGEPLPEFIPAASRLFVQPVEQSFDFFDYHAPVPMFQPAATSNDRTKPLAEPVLYSMIGYDGPIPLSFSWDSDVKIDHSGRFNALRFLTQNFLAFDVAQQRAIPWSNQFLVLPVEHALDVAPGQHLRVQFQYEAGQSLETLQQSIRCAVAMRPDARKSA